MLHIYGAGSIYAFEASMVANKLKFTVFVCPAGNVISRVIESEEMEQMINDFLKENIENYDNLLQEEVERSKNEAEISGKNL